MTDHYDIIESGEIVGHIEKGDDAFSWEYDGDDLAFRSVLVQADNFTTYAFPEGATAESVEPGLKDGTIRVDAPAGEKMTRVRKALPHFPEIELE